VNPGNHLAWRGVKTGHHGCNQPFHHQPSHQDNCQSRLWYRFVSSGYSGWGGGGGDGTKPQGPPPPPPPSTQLTCCYTLMHCNLSVRLSWQEEDNYKVLDLFIIAVIPITYTLPSGNIVHL
jgi:hypothetical protein